MSNAILSGKISLSSKHVNPHETHNSLTLVGNNEIRNNYSNLVSVLLLTL